MSDRKIRHTWPTRGPAERRLYPRVRVGIPIAIDDGGGPTITGMTADVGLGGVRATLSKYIELFTRLSLAMELPVIERDKELNFETITATVAVVRIEPPEELEDQGEYDVSLAFTGPSADRDRVLGTFLLQALLFDQEAELT